MSPSMQNGLCRCGYLRNNWSLFFHACPLDSILHTAASVFFYSVHPILLPPSLNLLNGILHTKNQLQSPYFCLQGPVCSCPSASSPALLLLFCSFFLGISHLGFLDILWTCYTYTFLRALQLPFTLHGILSFWYPYGWVTPLKFLLS